MHYYRSTFDIFVIVATIPSCPINLFDNFLRNGEPPVFRTCPKSPVILPCVKNGPKKAKVSMMILDEVTILGGPNGTIYQCAGY
jgi:hypothetical protein